MKKKLAIFALLLAAALLVSCAGQQNNEAKQLTAKDIEGTWTVSDSSARSAGGKLSLDGFMLKPDTSAVLIFRDGKITWEWEAQDGKKTSDEGSYEVIEGDLFISSVKIRAKLEGKTLTLTELAPPKGEGAYKEEDGVYKLIDDPSVTEVPDKAVVILERK